MPPGRRNLQGPLDMFLALDLGKIGIKMMLRFIELRPHIHDYRLE